jgi:hypothetical protein
MSTISQKGANGPLALQASGSFQSSTDANLATLVGTRWDLSDGREVMLVSVGATALNSVGVLVQDAAIVANAQGVAVTAFQAYSANGNIPAVVSVGTNATAVVANQYQGGFVMVDSGPGIGQTLKISGNSVIGATTAGTITLEDSPNTALTTSSTVCLLPPHGANVIINPTTPTGAVAGVTLYTLAAGSAAGGTGAQSYGFVATRGLVAAISDATTASVGQAISPSTTTAGDVTVALAGGTTPTAIIGYANQTAVSAKSRSVFLQV